MTLNHYFNALHSFAGSLAFLFILFSANLLHSQADNAPSNPKEIGIRFSGFNDFNLMYKVSKSENVFKRHRFIITSFAFNTRDNNFRTNLGYAFGKETRKRIKEDFGYFLGPEFRFSILYNSDEGQNDQRFRQITIQPSIGLVLGVFLELSDKFILSGEIIPAFTASYTESNTSDFNLNLDATFNTNSTSLTLMYRF